MSIPKLLIMLIVFGLGLSGPVARAEQSPQALVEQVSGEMLTELRANRAALQADATKLYDLIKEILLPHFDFELMARWVLGKHWRDATEAQRREFTEAFRTLLVRSYGSALLEYADEDIIFPPSPKPPADAKDTTVHSVVELDGQEPISIDYSLRRRKEGWKVYDVTIDNVSLIINYRSTFDNQIQDQGIEGMIEDLKNRNAKGLTS